MNRFLIAIIVMPIILVSCTITKRYYTRGYHVEWKKSYRGNSDEKSINSAFVAETDLASASFEKANAEIVPSQLKIEQSIALIEKTTTQNKGHKPIMNGSGIALITTPINLLKAKQKILISKAAIITSTTPSCKQTSKRNATAVSTDLAKRKKITRALLTLTGLILLFGVAAVSSPETVAAGILLIVLAVLLIIFLVFRFIFNLFSGSMG